MYYKGYTQNLSIQHRLLTGELIASSGTTTTSCSGDTSNLVVSLYSCFCTGNYIYTWTNVSTGATSVHTSTNTSDVLTVAPTSTTTYSVTLTCDGAGGTCSTLSTSMLVEILPFTAHFVHRGSPLPCHITHLPQEFEIVTNCGVAPLSIIVGSTSGIIPTFVDPYYYIHVMSTTTVTAFITDATGATATVNYTYVSPIIDMTTDIIPSGVPVVWSGINKVYHGPGVTAGAVFPDIVIEPGATLIIKDSWISFDHGSKIVVKAGGRLIVDNSTLSGYYGCNTFWHGIDVYGSVLPQPSGTVINNTGTTTASALNHQGVVIIKNNSRIENMREGIRTLWNKCGVGSVKGVLSGGGIIQVNNSTFSENVKSIQMGYYPKQRVSYARNSIFQREVLAYNDDYYWIKNAFGDLEPPPSPDIFYPKEEIYLEKCYGFGVNNCEFRNQKGAEVYSLEFNPVEEESDKGIGIRCLDAQVNIGIGHSAFNNFKGLYRGVQSTATGAYLWPLTTKIHRSYFDLCNRCVMLSGLKNVKVTSCDMAILPQMAEQSYGLYMDGCDGYTVEGNTFTTHAIAGYSSATYGTYTKNSGPNNNMIYRNEFADVQNGCGAEGINGSIFDIAGLQYKCNEFGTGIATHIANFGRIAYRQGSATVSAGNIFAAKSGTYGASNAHLYSAIGSNHITYYRHIDADRIPTLYNAFYVYVINTTISVDSTTCKSSGSFPIILSDIFKYYDILENDKSGASAVNINAISNTQSLLLIHGLKQIENIKQAKSFLYFLKNRTLYGTNLMAMTILSIGLEEIEVLKSNIKSSVLYNHADTLYYNYAQSLIDLYNKATCTAEVYKDWEDIMNEKMEFNEIYKTLLFNTENVIANAFGTEYLLTPEKKLERFASEYAEIECTNNNPINDLLYINCNTNEQVNVLIYTIEGKLLTQYNAIGPQSEIRLDVADGIYICKIFSNNNTVLKSLKIIVQK